MTGRRIYLAAAAGWVTFIVWGSLYPFRLRSMSLTDAGDRLWATRWMLIDPAAWSLTDVASNAVLFIPFGLFLSAAFERNRHIRHVPVVLAVSSLLLSLSLEFGQAYIRRRAPSLLDVAIALIGTAAGVGIWRVFRTRVEAAAAAVVRLWSASSELGRVSMVYTGLFACAWLLPFDFTIRPHEIKLKYEHQRLLLPLSTSPDAAPSSRLALMFVAAVPVGVAARVLSAQAHRDQTAGGAVLLTIIALVALEAVQVLVFSRTTDMAELVAAVPGAMLGAVVAGTSRR